MTRQPFHVLVKPSGPGCNLACDYCFYRPKEALYPDAEAMYREMTPDIAAVVLPGKYIKEAVIADVRGHIGEQEVYDDITLVVLKQK